MLGRFAHFLPGFAHVFARLADRIELLLLGRREEWTDLRLDVIADCFDFLPRFLTDRRDLRLGLFEDRADFRLLLGRDVQCFGHVFERVSPVAGGHCSVHSRFRGCARGGKSD